VSNNLTSFDVLPASAFVRLPVVCELFGIAPATVWRWSQEGKLPRPKKISERVSGWQVGELRKKLREAASVDKGGL
jgi:predicted DNA-binding transcriptional regulator AlpA